jgi:hypothetical protein
VQKAEPGHYLFEFEGIRFETWGDKETRHVKRMKFCDGPCDGLELESAEVLPKICKVNRDGLYHFYAQTARTHGRVWKSQEYRWAGYVKDPELAALICAPGK